MWIRHKVALGATILFLIISEFAQGQINSVSPFSLFGLGDKSNGLFAQQQGMGGVNQALRSPYSVNLGNPASYSSLRLATLDFGGVQKFVWQSSNGSDPITNSTGYFNYLALGFPLTENWGMGIAITPYSIVGYDIRSSVEEPDYGNTVYRYTGQGGVNKVVWGNSYRVYKGLSLGINAAYLFGTTDTRRDALFTDPSIDYTRLQTETTVSDFGFDAGFQWEHTWDSKKNTRVRGESNTDDDNDMFFVLGGTYGFGSELRSNQSGVAYTYRLSNTGSEIPLDTGSLYVDRSGNIKLPTSFGLGFSYGRRVPELLVNAWMIEADLQTTQWSGFVPFDGSPSSLTDSYRFSAGGYFIPNFAFGNQSRRGNYFETIKYRFGTFYERTNITYDSQSLPDYGFTFGMDLPFRAKSVDPGDVKLSTINVGIVFGRRGFVNSGSVQEDYINLYFGINLNDKWFRKFKYR